MANATSGAIFAEGLFTGVGLGMTACVACAGLARALRGPVRMMYLGYATEAQRTATVAQRTAELNALLLGDIGGAAADLGGAAAAGGAAAPAAPAAPAADPVHA